MHSSLECQLESCQNIARFLFESIVICLVPLHIADTILDHSLGSSGISPPGTCIVGDGPVECVATRSGRFQESSIHEDIEYFCGCSAHRQCCLLRKTVWFRRKC